MIVGIGTDIIEIERVERAIQNQHFKERVFTEKEINYCNSRGRQKAASYAARFAGKEAFFKAMGTGINCSMTLVEILNDELGKPYINLSKYAEKLMNDIAGANVQISLSHSKNYATAVCIIEK